MAETSTFSIALDNRISGPAGDARASLSSLRTEMIENRRSLSELERATKRMGERASKSADGARKASSGIAGVASEAGDAAREIWGLRESLLLKVGALGAAASGALAVVGAVRSMVSSVIDAATSLGRYALASAEARREETLRLEVMGRIRSRTRDAGADALATSEAIDRVADRTGVARSELEGYASSAYRAGLRGAALEAALRGAAARGSALGERWGRSFIGAAAAAGRAGQDIGRLADETERRYSDLSQRQLRSSGSLWRRFTSNISSWFRDIDVDPLLESLSEFVSLFSRSNEVGKYFSSIFTSVGNDSVGILARMVRAMGRFVEGTVLALINAENQWLTFRLGVTSAAADVAEAVAGIRRALGGLTDMVPEWMRDGSSLASGLVRGLAAGTGPAGRAATSVVESAERAMRQAAQIRSPSRLFADLGRQLGAGVEVGIDGEVPRVQRAAEALVEPPSIRAPRATAPALAPPEMPEIALAPPAPSAEPVPRGGEVSIVVGDIVIQSSATSGEGMLDDLRERVTELFLDAAAAAGVA